MSVLKKTVSIFLAALMLVGVFAIMPLTAGAEEIVTQPSDGNTDSEEKINSRYVNVGVKGSYYANIEQALKRINEIRYEACSEGIKNPAKPSEKLTLEDYHEIKYSSELEKSARLRAVEALVTNSHTRANGKSCFTVDEPIVKSVYEVLAWNETKDMVYGIDQFYEEKVDWINNTGKQTGHYEDLINPSNYYIGLGGFFSNDAYSYPSCLCGRLSGKYSDVDETKGSATEETIVPIEVKTKKLENFGILSDSSNLVINQNSRLEMIADYDGSRVFLGENVEWSSSDKSVATVSEDGVITAFAEGEVTITAKKDNLTATRIFDVYKDINKNSGRTGDCKWTLNGTELTISGNGKMGDYIYKSELPWGKNITKVTFSSGVTKIGAWCFNWCTNLKTVVIPNGVTDISDYAFYDCTRLSSVTIPDSVERIGFRAFCGTVWNVNLPEGLVYCGKVAYAYNGECPQNIEIKEGTLGIAGDAFEGCDTLKKVSLPDSLKIISKYAFWGCSKLESINIPKNLKRIENYALSDCLSLKKVNITDIAAWCKIKFDSKNANPLYYDKTGHANLYLNGELLEDLIIPDGVESICDFAFYDGDSIKSVTVPASVKYIGEDAFYCRNISRVNITEIASWLEIEFENNYSDPLYYGKGTAKLYLNGELLEDLVIPDGVENIRDYAFYNCDSIKSVTISNTVKHIGEEAFSCPNLTSVTIPDSVKSIGEYAFACPNISRVNITDIASWCNINFENGFSNPIYYGSTGDTSLYLNGELIEDLVVPEGVESIGAYAFAQIDHIKSVTVPESLNEIGESAFGYCNGLNRVNISNLAKWCNIKFEDEFSNPLCSANNLYVNGEEVIDLTIPEGVESISDYAFHTAFIYSVSFPDSVKTIGKHAFEDNYSLTDVNIGGGVTTIGENAFWGCQDIESIELPENVTTINKEALGYYYYGKLKDFIIYGKSGTAAEAYARENGFEFKDLSELPTQPTPEKEIKVIKFDENSIFTGDADMTVIIFGRPSCFNTRSTLESLAESDLLNNNRVKIYFADIDQNDERTIKAFAEEINDPRIVFCYDTSTNATQTMFSNVEAGGVTLPVIVYYDRNNNAAECESGMKTAEQIFDTVENNITPTENNPTDPTVPTENTEPTYSTADPVDNPTESTENNTEPTRSTVSPTEIETEPETNKPADTAENTQTISYLPSKEQLENGDRIKLVIKDNNEEVYVYEMTPNALMYDGIPVYTAKIPADISPDLAQIQVFKGDTWVSQVNLSASQIASAKGKIITSDGSFYGEKDNPTDPTQPSSSRKTPKVTSKKDNPIKVTVKVRTIKAKKLKKKAQKVKAITVKGNQGKVAYKLVKSGITKKIRKLCKINSKGVITIKKWKKAKKGTYKIKVKVTAAGNSSYKAKTITKTVKVKIK